jgi:hypothetical protein
LEEGALTASNEEKDQVIAKQAAEIEKLKKRLQTNVKSNWRTYR